MQAPGGDQEDRSGNFTQGGWSVNYWDKTMEEIMTEDLARPFDLLLGRKTYEIFAAHWPFIEGDPTATMFNDCTKYVATKTLTSATWQNTVLLHEDFVSAVRKIKAAHGPDLQVHGSSNMIQSLLKNNLVDELNIWIFPVVIGQGKRLFEAGINPRALKLVKHRMATTGVILTTYKPDGDIQLGTFALEEPTELEKERRKSIA